MAKDNIWSIQIRPPMGGLAPLYWESDYTFFGNANQAKHTKNIDITKPDRITQGPGLVALTNGTQAGNVDTLIKQILDRATADNVTYGCGGANMFTISSTAVTAKTAITNSTDANGIASYNDDVYVFYNKATGADIAKWDGTTLDADWGSTTVTSNSINSGLHPSVSFGSYMYFGNGQYVGKWDGLTLSGDGLDFMEGSEVVDITFNANLLYIGVNYPSLTGSNRNDSRIYRWDGFDADWEDSIKVNGRIGCVWDELGTVFVIYEELDSGIIKIGYVYGNSIRELPNASFKGSLPLYYQRTKYKGHTLFVSGSEIVAFGASSRVLPPSMFSYIAPTQTTIGGISAPFGSVLVATNATTNYSLSKTSGYSTTSEWKSINMDVAPPSGKSMLKYIEVKTNKMGTGASANLVVNRNQGTSSDDAFVITGSDTIHRKYYQDSAEDFRIELNWSGGSATNPVEIKSITIVGEYITN